MRLKFGDIVDVKTYPGGVDGIATVIVAAGEFSEYPYPTMCLVQFSKKLTGTGPWLFSKNEYAYKRSFVRNRLTALHGIQDDYANLYFVNAKFLTRRNHVPENQEV